MTAYGSTPSRDPEQRKTPPILTESEENSHKTEKAIIAPADLIADDQLPQEKRIIATAGKQQTCLPRWRKELAARIKGDVL